MSRKSVLVGASLLVLGALTTGRGAEAAPAAADSASAAPEVQSLIVTARKREEDIEKVPVAVTAVSQETIKQLSMTQLSDVQQSAPNVFFTENSGAKGTSRVFIRGIGEATGIFTADPAVGIYVDGIPLTRPQGSNVGLLDVQRVEVLRGPQGTTFGKNTIGGSINFVSRTPGSHPSADLVGRFGNYNDVEIQAAADLPVSDQLGFRFSASVNERDGFVKNAYDGGRLDDLNNWDLRAMAKWQPAPNFDLLVSADYFRRNEHSKAPQLLSFNPSSVLVSLFDASAFSRYGFHPFAMNLDDDPFRTFGSGGGPAKPGAPDLIATDPERSRYAVGSGANRTNQEIWGAYAIANWSLNDQLSVKSLTSYRKTLTNAWIDSFGTAIPVTGSVTEEDAREFSQELQLNGSNLMGGRLNFVSGVFFGDTKTLEVGTQWFEPELMATVFNLSTSRDETQTTKSYAVFGNASYKITDPLQVTVGFRWTEDRKDFHRHEFAAFPGGTNIGFGAALPPARPQTTGAPVIFNLRQTWPAWSGTVAVQYQWTPDVMTYVSWSRGFRSGGFSGSGRSPFEVQPYDPEFVDDYEVGVRSTLFDNRLVLNATAYTMDYTNRQLGALFVDQSVTPFVSRFVIFNAGASRQRGVEIEATARPTRFLDAHAAYGLTDAKYTELKGALVAGDTVAHDLDLKLPNTPRDTANADIRLHAPLGGLPGEFSANLSWFYRGKVYFDIANSESIAQKGFGLLNARVAWTSTDRTLEAAIWARNLTDHRYRTDGVNVAGNFAAGLYGDPRTWGVELRKSF